MKNYLSPTTPGLKIDFRNYLIELMCLNIYPKLGSKFWNDPRWNKKYRMELRGFSNFKKSDGQVDMDNPMLQSCIVNIVRKERVRSLVRINTVSRILKMAQEELVKVIEKNTRMANAIPEQDKSKNDGLFVDLPKKNPFNKVRLLESGKKDP